MISFSDTQSLCPCKVGGCWGAKHQLIQRRGLAWLHLLGGVSFLIHSLKGHDSHLGAQASVKTWTKGRDMPSNHQKRERSEIASLPYEPSYILRRHWTPHICPIWIHLEQTTAGKLANFRNRVKPRYLCPRMVKVNTHGQWCQDASECWWRCFGDRIGMDGYPYMDNLSWKSYCVLNLRATLTFLMEKMLPSDGHDLSCFVYQPFTLQFAGKH